MRQQYTAFQFDGQTYHEDMSSGFKLINATLDSDFYMQCIRGPRKIVEDKIPGRDIPYFYEVDDDPLEFDVTFAFAEYMTKTQIKAIVRKLFSPTTYKQLTFGDYESSTYTAKTPIYKVMFHGETDINYVQGANDTYIAYFTLTARADRPYGYQNTTQSYTTSSGSSTVNIGTAHTSPGDINVYPSIVITNQTTTAGAFSLRVRSAASGGGTILSEVSFTTLKANEIITINANLFTITSNNSQSDVYSRWERNKLEIYPGSNWFQIVKADAVRVDLSYEAPIYIYDED